MEGQDNTNTPSCSFTETATHFIVSIGETTTTTECEQMVETMAAISMDKPRLWSLPDLMPWSEEEIIRLGEHGKNIGLRAKTAIVAKSDLSYAMARQHMVYRVDNPDLVNLFRNEKDATQWIGLD